MSILASVIINALILAVLPYSHYKSFFSCIKVSFLTAFFLTPLSILSGIIGSIATFILKFIPILGWLAIPFVYLFLSILIITIALRIADAMIEDFEIKSLLNTMITACVLGFCNAGAFSMLG